MKTTTVLLASAFALHLQAQTPYSYTLPQMQGVGLQNWTTFTFPGTPNTVGGSTITFDWLACYQGGFGTTGVDMRIRVGATTYITVLNYTGGTISCSFQPRTVDISAAIMQQALAFTGGTALEGQVRVDDGCQPGVGCSSYNDPVVKDLTLTYTTEAANFTSPDPTKCPGEVVQFIDASINAPTSHSWSFPGGMPATSDLPSPVVQYAAPGQYDVSLTVVTSDGESSLTLANFVTIHDLPTASAGADQFLCAGGSVPLQASGGTSYQWTPVDGLSNPAIAAPTASPEETTTYTVLVTSAQGCQANDQVQVTVVPLPVPMVDDAGGTLCSGDSLTLTASGAAFYNWSPNLFISATSGASVQVWPTADQSWTVVGTDLYGCTGEAVVEVDVVPAATVPEISWADMVLSCTEASSYQWYLESGPITEATEQTWTPVVNGNYSVAITDPNGCTAVSEPYYFGTVGMDAHSRSDVRVYPQPAKGTLHVSGVTNGTAYRLLDARGRVVAEGILQGANAAIDIRSLAAGMHVLELGGDDAQRMPVMVE